MKKNLQLIMAIALAISVSMVSCKKSDTNTNTDDSLTELSTHTDDENNVSGDIDAIADEANAVIDGYGSFSGRIMPPTNNVLCNGVAVLDSTATDRRLTVTYNGTNCANTRILNGQIILTMPLSSRWRDAGAVLTVTTNGFRVTRVIDNKTVTISGVKTITNVSGGIVQDLPSLPNGITQDIASNGITVTFDNNTQRTWQVARRRNFTYNNGIIITITGRHTEGSTTGIAEWGTNRFGNNFITTISNTNPIVIRQDCNFRIVSGELAHQRLIADVVVTFGLDATGNAISCPGTGLYYFKLVWTGLNGVVRTVILPY